MAEWIDAEGTSAALYRRVRHEWKNNAERQPIGCVKQLNFEDSTQCLTRIIEVPKGRCIGEQIFEQRIELDTVLPIAIALTKVLEDWHRLSRVHGWLSPSCVFVDEKNRVAIGDASVIDVSAQQDFLLLPVQDLAFVSPESSGLLSRKVSPASDLYSVGAMIYGLLSSKRPIEAETSSEHFDRQLCMQPSRLRDRGLQIPPMLDEIVARLLHRDPRKRYETASALLIDLEHLQRIRVTPQAESLFAIGTGDLRTELTDPPLIGRDKEIDAIEKLLKDSKSGVSRSRFITGTEVSYRRLLVDEIRSRALAKGSFVLRGGASVSTNIRPLESLENVLTGIVELCDTEPNLASEIAEATRIHAPTLCELMPGLSHLWPDAGTQTGPEEYGRERAAIALSELIAALAKDPRGITLLFDDLDIADSLSQSVMRAIISRVTHEPGNHLLCIVTGTSPESFDASSRGTYLQLGPLTSEALEQCLESSAGKLSKVVTRSIVEIADGNATMAAAILGRMIDTKVVTPSPNGWVSNSQLADALRSDESFAEMLERHLKALPEKALKLLGSAAVVGSQFQLKMLAELTGVPFAEVLDVATDALARRLLWCDTRPGWYCFANEQIQQRLCNYVDEEDRQKIHSDAIGYFREHDPSNYFELAFHYDASGQGDLALRTSLLAAKVARKRFSLSVALDQLKIAKRWVSVNDRETALEIWEGLGTVNLLAGDYSAAAKYLNEAVQLVDRPFDKARVQQQIGEVAFKRGQFAEAATHFERALAMTGVMVPGNVVTMIYGVIKETLFQVAHSYLPTRWVARRSALSDIDSLRLLLLSRLSHVYFFSRHKLWTLGNHLRAMNEAERFAISTTLAVVYSEHGPAMTLLRWYKRAHRYAERSLEIRTQLEDVWGQGQSYDFHSVVMLAEARYHDAIATAKKGVDLLRQTGDVWEMNMARYQEACALYRTGRFTEACEAASQIYELGSQVGDLQASGISLDVWARTSPQSLSLELVKNEAARSRPDAQSNAQTQLGYAVVLLHHNQIDEAIDVLREAIDRCEQAGHLNTYISPCYAWLGTAMRLRLESTDCRDGRRFQQRLTATRAAVTKAVRLSKGFPGDRCHALRELAIVDAVRGKIACASRRLISGIEVAATHSQAIEELDTLRVLQSLHEQHNDLLGPFPDFYIQRLSELDRLFSTVSDEKAGPTTSSTNLSLADRFVTVLRSGRRITQALSPDLVYAEARESARRLLRGEHCDVVNICKVDNNLTISLSDARNLESSAHHRIAENEALIRMAVCTKRAVYGDLDSSVSLESTGSAIAAPIAFRGEIVAVILVTHHELKGLFGDDEQRIADFISTLAGAALENADGFLQLQQMNDTLEQRVVERTKAAEDRAQQLSESNQRLRATEEQLRDAILQANAASEAKSRFLATMSHEIRTPLNGILGMTRLARLSSNANQQIGYMETVEESGQSLLTLINDLLDFSKLEAGKMELERIPINFELLAGEVCRLMAASAWQKGIELICDVEPTLPINILGDPSRLRQIIINLIGNAIKFTEQGYVAVAIQIVKEGDTECLSIAIQDSGIGIPVHQQEKVFESFSQADSSTTRKYGGTGLGLAICRELSERMDGSIEVCSTLGFGSTFTVKLPIEFEAGEPKVNRVPSLAGYRIGVMDTHEASRIAITTALRSTGADVTAWPCDCETSTCPTLSDPFKQAWDLVIFGCEGIDNVVAKCADNGIPCLIMQSANPVSVPSHYEWFAELRKPAVSSEIISVAEALIKRDHALHFSATGDSMSRETVTSDDQQRVLALPRATVEVGKSIATFEVGTIEFESSQVRNSDRENVGNSGKRPQILVAEDGMINQEVIVGLLEMQGYEVVVANNGIEAVEIASKRSFDICMMDVDMPQLDGLDATKAIRKNETESTTTRLPIIAMTAHSDDEIWDICRTAGMDGYLSKPIDPTLLFAKIESYCPAMS